MVEFLDTVQVSGSDYAAVSSGTGITPVRMLRPWGFLQLGRSLIGVAKADLGSVDAVVMVINDPKSDWSMNGIPHPVLVSEARAVSAKGFRPWTVDKFHAHVESIAS